MESLILKIKLKLTIFWRGGVVLILLWSHKDISPITFFFMLPMPIMTENLKKKNKIFWERAKPKYFSGKIESLSKKIQLKLTILWGEGLDSLKA